MPPPNRVRWSRAELLIVLNLYHKLRFGQFDGMQRLIVDLVMRKSFEIHQGKPLDLPADGIPPDAEFLANHRQRFRIA